MTICRDQYGSPLTSRTNYTLKAIALAFGMACSDLLNSDFESDEITVVTDFASLPNPPKPSVLLLSGCSLLVTALPPDDYNGAMLYGYTVQISAISGNSKTLSMDLDSSSITIADMLAFTNYSIMASVSSDFGDSAFSDQIWVETGEPCAPSKLKALNASRLGSDSVWLNWSEPSNSGGGVITGTKK